MGFINFTVPGDDWITKLSSIAISSSKDIVLAITFNLFVVDYSFSILPLSDCIILTNFNF